MKASGSSPIGSGKVGSMREGILQMNILLTGQDGSPNNYVLMINRAGSGGWATPRHRHNFDQFRFVVEGNYPLQPGKTMQQGTTAYFPESVPYGPQDRPEGLLVLTLQCGGASGNGFLSVAQREAANDVLKKKGEFKNGIFTYVDEHGHRRSQDGSEACFEQATGHKVSFAKPRYEDLIMMDPANYEWIPDGRGVASKWLGTFTERNERFGFVRIDTDATFSAGTEPAIELMFVSKGRVAIDGKEYATHTAFEFEPREGPIAVKALGAQSELLRMILPRFD